MSIVLFLYAYIFSERVMLYIFFHNLFFFEYISLYLILKYFKDLKAVVFNPSFPPSAFNEA